LRKALILALACVILSPTVAPSQKRRPRPQRRGAATSKPSKAAESLSADLRAGRERIAAQIKILTQFLYLLGGITKGIESADQAARNREASSTAIQQNERNKSRVKESLRNVREGLDKLQADFRSNPRLKSFYPYVADVAAIGESAENQAAANRFDEAGRSLLKAVNQLTDALAAMR
jgi:uncharacterized phage infection (PIP) family protein YhgE